jgi:hypothetical protein
MTVIKAIKMEIQFAKYIHELYYGIKLFEG